MGFRENLLECNYSSRAEAEFPSPKQIRGCGLLPPVMKALLLAFLTLTVLSFLFLFGAFLIWVVPLSCCTIRFYCTQILRNDVGTVLLLHFFTSLSHHLISNFAVGCTFGRN